MPGSIKAQRCGPRKTGRRRESPLGRWSPWLLFGEPSSIGPQPLPFLSRVISQRFVGLRVSSCDTPGSGQTQDAGGG